MQRPKIIKSIFWELRAAGVEGSARDVLRLADFILRSHLDEVGSSDDFGRVVDSRTLPLVPVDYAIADGGWGILGFEQAQLSFIEHDCFERFALRRKIERYLGPLWYHSTPQD